MGERECPYLVMSTSSKDSILYFIFLFRVSLLRIWEYMGCVRTSRGKRLETGSFDDILRGTQ